MEKIQIPKLKGKSNWSVWKLQIESSLQYHDFEGVLTGQIVEPAVLPADASNQQKKEHEAALKAYKKANGFSVTLISTSVEDEPLQLIMMYKTAREMWLKLTASYEQKSEQRLEHLYLQLLEYRKDASDSIATHISKLQKLWLELNEESMRVDRANLPQTLLLMRILSTLPQEYFEFRTTWESVPRDQRTVEYLQERLTMVEMRVSQKRAEEPGTCTALISKFKQNSVTKQKQAADFKPKKDHSKIKCYSCGNKGHFQNKCPNLKKDDNDKKKDSDHSHKAEALCGVALVMDGVSESSVWISDTGASHHMTNSTAYFSSYKMFDEPRPIIVGNQRTMLAYGSGNIRVEALVDDVWREHYLSDVWYAPDVVKNLFSVPAAADKGLTYRLDKSRCELVKQDTVIVTGERHHGLYKLHLRPIQPEMPATVLVTFKPETLQVWHERLGHQSKTYVEKFLKARSIKFVKDNSLCEGCIMGKQHRFSFGTRLNSSSKPGDLVHADVCGPMQVNSFSGFRYYVVFKDDYTKYRCLYFLKEKSEVHDKLKLFLAEAKTAGHTVKELLTDGGGEFDNGEIKKIVNEYGINHRMTMPYTPEQNGAAERENRTIMEAARSMLHSTTLPSQLWAEAVNTAVYVLNRSAPTKVEGKTPYELWHNKEAPTEHLKVFGTDCFVHIPKQNRKKLDAKSLKGHLVGYSGNRDGYRVYVPEKGTVILSRDVIFVDEKTVTATAELESESDTEVDMSSNDSNEQEDGEDLAVENQPRLRNRQQIRQPNRFDDYVMIAEHDEPVSYSQAITSDYSREWKAAMDDEIKSLAENNTWQLVTKPEGRKVIDSKWVYKVKVNTDGTVDKFKARLVAKGYEQKAGVDYTETFSPVARYDTIRAVFSVIASENLHVSQFDVKTAFLYGELQEEIFMRQPDGYDDSTERVCKLNRSLYGLKQSPRCWNRRFKAFMENYGLRVSEADPCLFVNTSAGHKLLVCLYVDDGFIAAEDQQDLTHFLTELQSEFKVTLTSSSTFLGLQYERLEDGSIAVTQEAYTKKVLEKFNMSDCNKTATPCERQDADCDNDEVSSIQDGVPYREAVGSLMYLAIGTRPDIAYAVSCVSQALDKPTSAHWAMVKRIFRYLRGTTGMKIVYQHGEKPGILTTYSDADYAGDIKTRRSTSGIVCVYMGGAISWSSQRQRSVALSTTEAEFVAASEAAKEIIWLSRLLNEITTLVAVPVLKVDNMSALKLVKNPTFHKRSKHIEVRHYFVREKYEEGLLTVEHISGDSQVADIFTKPLQKNRFQCLRPQLGLRVA